MSGRGLLEWIMPRYGYGFSWPLRYNPELPATTRDLDLVSISVGYKKYLLPAVFLVPSG